MNIDRIVKNIVREVLINEGRKRKEPLDDRVDGKRLLDMLPETNSMVKELARPIYAVRQQKENVDKFSDFYRKKSNYFVKVANKFNKIKMSEGDGPYKIEDIIRLIYQYSFYVIRSSNNPNNQLDGADSFLKFYPEEVKEWDDSKKQEIEEFAKTIGEGSSNFFISLIYDKDFDLIDIMSNIDFILELRNKYRLNLLNLSLNW